MRPVAFWLAAVLALSAAGRARCADLPEGFVFLGDVDPGIVQEMRYAGAGNFTGEAVPGYEGGECVLARPVAEALSRVQTAAKAEGRTLIVFDCYRPQRAVDRFVAWVKAGGAARDPVWHPRIARNQLVAKGYIASRSGHSSGGSVDLGFGVATPGEAGGPPTVEPAKMGGAFDMFDVISHTRAKTVPRQARANREWLVSAMKAQGFANYDREWWHFRYTGEPFAGRAFDFVIPARR